MLENLTQGTEAQRLHAWFRNEHWNRFSERGQLVKSDPHLLHLFHKAEMLFKRLQALFYFIRNVRRRHSAFKRSLGFVISSFDFGSRPFFGNQLAARVEVVKKPVIARINRL